VLDSLPGNPLMWVLILSELLVFGSFFAAFSVDRIMHPVLFAQSQVQLGRLVGGMNTMVLVTSSLTVAFAVRSRSVAAILSCRLWLAATVVLGAVFLTIKLNEYADYAAHGIVMEANDFFTLFYLLTGFHALHVVFGITLLGIVGWKCSFENLETGAAFWHMVDLIWILLYPIIYLIR
jgi:nitric oxide reductase NorE protein